MDKESFSQAVEQNNKRLYMLALSYTKNIYDAEDILQNVFLKLWKYDKGFNNSEHMENWLTRVCINECKNYIRMPFRKNLPLDEAINMNFFDKPRDYDVFNAVMSLPKNERTVIHLFYYEDMSIKEIAKMLKIKEPTIKTRLHRARTNLKKKLGEDWING